MAAGMLYLVTYVALVAALARRSTTPATLWGPEPTTACCSGRCSR
jgi:hypothetical protein